MKRRTLATLTVLAGVALAAMPYTETVTLNNGNRYIGRILRQQSDGQITFSADTSIIYLPVTEIDRIYRRDASDGSKRRFADIYIRPQVKNVPRAADADADTVAAASAGESDDTIAVVEAPSSRTDRPNAEIILHNVEILEDGSVVRYLDPRPATVTTAMSEIKSITRPSRESRQLNGLDDEIVTRRGDVYRGSILENEPGKSTRILSDGRIYNFGFGDIAIHRKVAVDPSQAVTAQSPVLDNITMRRKGGTLEEVVLVEQNYADGTFDAIDKNNVRVRRRLADIDYIVKEANPDFKPRYDFVFAKDSVYINRKAAVARPYLTVKGSSIEITKPDTIMEVIANKGIVTIEGDKSVVSARLLVVPVKFTPKGNVLLDSDELYRIAIPVNEQTIDAAKGIMRRTFNLGRGHYAVIDTDRSNAITVYVR